MDQNKLTEKSYLARVRKSGSDLVIRTLNTFANPISNRDINTVAYNQRRKFFDLAIVGLILVLGVVGFFFWFIFSPKEAPVNLEIICSPTEIASGSDLSCQFNYKNEGQETLYGASLAIEFPKQFKLDTDDLENFDVQNNTFSIGDLKPGASGKLKISGNLWGDVNQKQLIKTMFSCQAENKKTLNKIEVKTFDLVGSLLKTELELPDKVYNQTNFEGKIKYRNDSSQNIAKAYLVIRYPTTYLPESVETDLKKVGENKFEIDNLAAGQSGEITLKGNLKEEYTTQSIWQEFGSQISLEFDGQELVQNEARKSVEVVFANLELNSTWEPKNATPGESLKYTLNYKNNEPYNLENLKVWVEVESYFVSLKNLKIDRATVEDNQIVWLDLGGLNVGQRGEISLDLPVLKQITVTNYETAKNFKIRLIPHASYNLSTLPDQQIFAVGEPVDILINSNLGLTAQARYFTDYGDQLGVGPLPPAATAETIYWISAKITNTTNEVNNLNLNIKLPNNARWTGKTNVSYGGALVYNQASKQVDWQADKLSTYLGKITPAYEIGFEVGITPNNNDIGKILPLVNSISISGTDAFTGEVLTKNIGALTTELKNDRFVKPEMYRVEAW